MACRFGIIEVDYPNLSDDEFRRIQTGESDTFPDGMSVTEYSAAVERLKQERASKISFLGPPVIEPAPTPNQEEKKEEEPDEDGDDLDQDEDPDEDEEL